MGFSVGWNTQRFQDALPEKTWRLRFLKLAVLRAILEPTCLEESLSFCFPGVLDRASRSPLDLWDGRAGGGTKHAHICAHEREREGGFHVGSCIAQESWRIAHSQPNACNHSRPDRKSSGPAKETQICRARLFEGAASSL